MATDPLTHMVYMARILDKTYIGRDANKHTHAILYFSLVLVKVTVSAPLASLTSCLAASDQGVKYVENAVLHDSGSQSCSIGGHSCTVLLVSSHLSSACLAEGISAALD